MEYFDAVKLMGVTTDKIYRKVNNITKKKLSGHQSRERIKPLGGKSQIATRVLHKTRYYYDADNIESRAVANRAKVLQLLINMQGEIIQKPTRMTQPIRSKILEKKPFSVSTEDAEEIEVIAQPYTKIHYLWGVCFFLPPLEVVEGVRLDIEPLLALLHVTKEDLKDSAKRTPNKLQLESENNFFIDLEPNIENISENSEQELNYFACVIVPDEGARRQLYEAFKHKQSRIKILLITEEEIEEPINKNTIPFTNILGGNTL